MNVQIETRIPAKPIDLGTVEIEAELARGGRQIGEMLARKARIAGCEPDLRALVTVMREDVSIVAAPVQGVAEVDPADYAKGADTGFVYMRNTKALNIKPGFYLLRAMADIREVGVTSGIQQFIAEDGSVAATWRAEFDTFSLRVPQDAPRRVTMGLSLRGSRVEMDHWCSNGTHHIVFDDDIVTPG